MRRTGEGVVGWILAGMIAGCGADGGETRNAPPAPTCEAGSADGIAVAATDPYAGAPYALGYPPYAIDGCRLAYVAVPAADTSAGELRVRDLAAGGETVVAPAAEQPRRPAIAGDLLAWEATVDGRAVVRVGGVDGVTTIAGPFHHAGEPRVAEDAVVFTAWLGPDDGADTDVYLYTPSTKAVTAVATGPAQQRFADVSAAYAAWSDFAEDPDGRFGDDTGDAADIVVLDRAMGTKAARARAGKQAFPMLGAEGKIAYLDWGLVHPEPKFSEYDLLMGELAGDSPGDVKVGHVMTLLPYVRPAARGKLIEWVEQPGGDAVLLRRGVDLTQPAEPVTTFEGATVFGPSAGEAIVLVGESAGGGPVMLRAFTR